MQTLTGPLPRVGRMLMALVLGGALVATPVPARAAPEGAAATFTTSSRWSGGYVGAVTVHNGTPTALTGWQVTVTLPAGTRVDGAWGAELSSDGDRYTFRNTAWNATLAPGGSASFGWVAAGNGTPVDCTFNGTPCAGPVGDPPDTTAPTTPGSVRSLGGYGFALQWEPSTDNRGVVGYEVFEDGRLIATVTGTSYIVSECCPLPPKLFVFAVRAVDAAGNRSPFGFHPMGADPRAAPVPPTNVRVAGVDAGVLRLAWDEPVVRGSLHAALAGYQVSVNGQAVGAVSGDSFRMPAPRPGTYTFSVRTFNVVGVLAAPVTISYTVPG